MAEKNQWDSQLSFLFAMIGAAVGLGNIWRFSYVVYTNGGGTFFIPYLIAIAILGVPFLILEYGVGFSFKDSFSSIMKKINPKLEFLSWILLLLVFIILIYYTIILSWDLVYLASSFNFAWGNDVAVFFVRNVGGSSNLSNIGTFLIPTLIGALIIWLIVWFVSHRDLNDGIGLASKILIPFLFIIMAGIVIYALTLPGANIGVQTLLQPDWGKLIDIHIWLAAFSQIIFSLSMGQAIALTYASYLPEGSKLTDNVLIVVFANSSFEIFTAFGIFSILGFMSYTTGTPIIQLISEGTGLIFMVFPMIFNLWGEIGHIVAPLLFLAILFAGVTSAVGIFEPMVSSLEEKLDWSRKKTVTFLCIIGVICSLIFTTGISSNLVRVVDEFVNEFGILLLIAIQCIIFTWIYDVDSLMAVINENGRFKVGSLWKVIVKYVLPCFLIIMWLIGVYNLLMDLDPFEKIVYIVITVVVLLFSGILTKIPSD